VRNRHRLERMQCYESSLKSTMWNFVMKLGFGLYPDMLPPPQLKVCFGFGWGFAQVFSG